MIHEKNQTISHFTGKKLGHSRIMKIPFTTLSHGIKHKIIIIVIMITITIAIIIEYLPRITFQYKVLLSTGSC